MRLSLDKDYKESLKLDGSMKDTLYIYRSTWGYLRAEVETEGDFLEVDKKIITSEDFIGSVFGLEYIILRDRLGKGKRYGKIRIHTVYGQLQFEIVASAANEYEISMPPFRKPDSQGSDQKLAGPQHGEDRQPSVPGANGSDIKGTEKLRQL